LKVVGCADGIELGAPVGALVSCCFHRR
jgi:hypothetical protein